MKEVIGWKYLYKIGNFPFSFRTIGLKVKQFQWNCPIRVLSGRVIPVWKGKMKLRSLVVLVLLLFILYGSSTPVQCKSRRNTQNQKRFQVSECPKTAKEIKKYVEKCTKYMNHTFFKNGVTEIESREIFVPDTWERFQDNYTKRALKYLCMDTCKDNCPEIC